MTFSIRNSFRYVYVQDRTCALGVRFYLDQSHFFRLRGARPFLKKPHHSGIPAKQCPGNSHSKKEHSDFSQIERGNALCAAGAQQGYDGVVTVAHSLQQSGGALLVAHVGVRARAQQCERDVPVAVHGRQHQRRAPLKVGAVRRLPLVLQHLRITTCMRPRSTKD